MDRPRRRDDVLLKDLGNQEKILYDPRNGKVHSLNVTAMEIWNLCDGRRGIEEIAERIISKFDVSRDQALSDIKKTVEKFKDQNLLQ